MKPSEDKNEESVDVFEKSMGSYGRYHIWLTFLIFLCKFPVGWHLLNIIIIGPKPNVTCVDNSTITDGCSPECKMRFIDPAPFTKTIQSEWELVCEDAYLANFAQMFTMLGTLFGSIAFGVWGDHRGRRFPLTIAVAIQSVCGTLIAFNPMLWAFLLLRFILAFSIGGTMTLSFVLLMELVGKKWRVTVATLYQIPTWLGHLTLSPIGYYLRDWRDSQLLVSLPPFLLILYIVLLPESPRFLVSAGRIDEAVDTLKRIARRNRLPTAAIANDIKVYADARSDQSTGSGSMRDLFRPRKMAFRTCVIALNWIVVGLCFYGVAQYASRLAGNVFVNIAMSAAMEVPGTFVAMLFNVFAGRKRTAIGACVIAGVPMLCIPLLAQDSLAVPSMALIAMFGSAGLFATLYVYTGELYPTFIRSVGVGFASMICRVGSISAPFVSTLTTYDFGLWLTPLIFGIAPLISGSLAFFLPETRFTRLPETMDDALRLGEIGKKRDAEECAMDGASSTNSSSK